MAFDIGGVLERVDDVDDFFARWRARCGLTPDEFSQRSARIDLYGWIGVGRLSEAEYRARWRDALGLDEAGADEFMADLWDWYCGELDEELVAFARTLRPAHRTGIISNSADGARREEQARYGFEQLVDEIVYSHEVGVAKPDPRIYVIACDRLGVRPDELVFVDDVDWIVRGAREFGIHAVHHTDTATTIAEVTALLADHG